jgi:hypothetical protein
MLGTPGSFRLLERLCRPHHIALRGARLVDAEGICESVGELDAAQARAEALERELERTKAELADAKGETALVPMAQETTALTPVNREYSRLAGIPKRLVYEREFEGELDEGGLAEIADMLRTERDEQTDLNVLKGSLAWSIRTPQGTPSPTLVHITSRRGKTHVKLTENLTTTLINTYVGVGIGAGLGVGITATTLFGVFASGIGAIALGPLLLGIDYALCRKAVKWRAKVRKYKAEGLFRRLVRLIESLLSKPEA